MMIWSVPLLENMKEIVKIPPRRQYLKHRSRRHCVRSSITEANSLKWCLAVLKLNYEVETGGQMASSSGSGGGGATSDPISPPSGSAPARTTDGWDNEEWGSLEEEPEAEAELTSPSEPWSAGDFAPATEDTRGQHRSISSHNWTQEGQTISNRKSQNAWEDPEFEPLDENQSHTNSRLEEAKKKREERKLMRQKEMEARRASRTGGGGPMKLGSKKM